MMREPDWYSWLGMLAALLCAPFAIALVGSLLDGWLLYR